MAWLTEAEFRELRIDESATQILPIQITTCLDAAIEKIADLCGDAIVAEITSGSNSDRKVKRFRRSQELFAFAELLPVIGHRFKNGGIQVKETDSNANSTNEYAKFADIQSLRNQLEADALGAISSYLTTEEKAEIDDFEELRFFPSSTVTRKAGW